VDGRAWLTTWLFSALITENLDESCGRTEKAAKAARSALPSPAILV
jgi:hypothetical protein